MNRPAVGVLVILQFNNKILLGKRKGSHGNGEWCFPGGHMELYETPEECGKRELEEETGINLKHLTPIDMGYTNDIFYDSKKHYITIYQLYNLDNFSLPQLKEPDKCYQWQWSEKTNLPEPLFLPVINYLTKFQNDSREEYFRNEFLTPTILRENVDKKNILIVISSKTPNPLLNDCIDSLYKIQIDDSYNYKICIVDSNSDDLTFYYKINTNFPNVEIHIVKNKNYEYGAWNYAQTIYPNYDIYFCIQDSMSVKTKIDLSLINDNNAYTFHNNNGYHTDDSIKQKGIENLKYTNLNFEPFINSNFLLAQCNSFIVNNNVMKDIFKTFTIPPIDKHGSCFYERNFGIYFIIKNINCIDLFNYMNKTCLNRT
jgi:8-oxo-dGTP diphosphatase